MGVDTQELPVKALAGPGAAAGTLVAGRDDGERGIARMGQGPVLSIASLDAKRLVHAEQADPRATDVFRELRSRLLGVEGLHNPVILVCGVRANVGASFVARNLAASIALDVERTALLVDCHWRRPSQQQVFELGDGPGLADYLRSGGMSPQAIIYRTGIPRLRVIPAGAARARDADLLCSLRMRALLNEMSQRYDERCIVLDAPPARGSPEALMLARRADLVLLVAGEGMHRAEDVRAAAASFDPARLAGVVFNELP